MIHVHPLSLVFLRNLPFWAAPASSGVVAM